jgi:DNA (cytosine-5)-methyltransferase 1
VWTGSCPCQPFSQVGERKGFEDERHLWPVWRRLIKKCRPAVIFGEQVASKDAEPWLDLVSANLEAMDFAFGAVAFPACGVGAPHARNRTYFVAHADHAGLDGRGEHGHVDMARLRTRQVPAAQRHGTTSGVAGSMAQQKGVHGKSAARKDVPQETNGFWREADWLFSRDGKWRCVQPGLKPLVNGTAQRLVCNCAACRKGKLRGYGNAVNAYQAAAFIKAASAAINDSLKTG